MKNKVFDILRFLAETGITALGVAYLGLSTIWHLPYGEEIKSTCIIISTLLGVFVGVSRVNYNKQFEAQEEELPEGEAEEEAEDDGVGEDE